MVRGASLAGIINNSQGPHWILITLGSSRAVFFHGKANVLFLSLYFYLALYVQHILMHRETFSFILNVPSHPVETNNTFLHDEKIYLLGLRSKYELDKYGSTFLHETLFLSKYLGLGYDIYPSPLLKSSCSK